MIVDEYQGDVIGAIEEEEDVVFLHGCNAQGAMGAGVAKQVRGNWPRAYQNYQKICDQFAPSELSGKVIWTTTPDVEIIHAITQRGYGGESPAKLEWIESCLEEVPFLVDHTYLTVRVGCGLGGLDWEEVRLKFEDSDLPWRVYYL